MPEQAEACPAQRVGDGAAGLVTVQAEQLAAVQADIKTMVAANGGSGEPANSVLPTGSTTEVALDTPSAIQSGMRPPPPWLPP